MANECNRLVLKLYEFISGQSIDCSNASSSMFDFPTYYIFFGNNLGDLGQYQSLNSPYGTVADEGYTIAAALSKETNDLHVFAYGVSDPHKFTSQIKAKIARMSTGSDGLEAFQVNNIYLHSYTLGDVTSEKI